MNKQNHQTREELTRGVMEYASAQEENTWKLVVHWGGNTVYSMLGSRVKTQHGALAKIHAEASGHLLREPRALNKI